MSKYRVRPLCLAITSALALSAWSHNTALAEEAQTEAEESGEQVELQALVVTGSRIAIPENLTTPNPVEQVTSEELELSGELDVAAYLRDMPALFTSLTANQSARTNSPLGVSQLNLRGLGTNRTLVLVNGRRNVSGVAGTAAVDLSSIPSSMIERIDVVTGGASAIYGADGVSGVVNVILRDDYDGFAYQARTSFTEDGGGETVNVNAIAGSNFVDRRGNVTVAVDFSRTGSIDSTQRADFAGLNLASFMPSSPELAAALGINPNAANTFATNRRLPVSSPNGIIWLQDANDLNDPGFLNLLDPGRTIGSGAFPVAQIIDDSGTLRAYNRGDFFVNLFEAVGGDGIPATPNLIELQPETTRGNINGNFSFEITPDVQFFTESSFSRMETLSRNQVNGFSDDIPIALDNPFIPDALRAQINQLEAEGITPEIWISRDNLDVPALSSAEQTSYRISSGFEGLLGDSWNYTVSYTFGQTDRIFTNESARVEDRFFAAVDAVRDPETGNIVCRSDLDPTAVPPVAPFPNVRSGFLTFSPGDGQCQPINLFGRDTTSAEAQDFVFQEARSKAKMTQQVFSAILAGNSADWFELPGGPLGMAVGLEYREEKSRFAPAELEDAGLLFNTVTTRSEPVDGKFDVTEVFGEVNVPILADRPFVEDLSLSAAVRVADYSTVGNSLSWSFGGTWMPIDDIRIRATYGQAVRAPNINELFSPPQPIFIGAAQDPCNENLIDAGSEFRRANCEALVGPNFDSTEFVSAFITGRAGGNPNLDEETAKSLTTGVVYISSALPGFTATLDYYEVTIDDAITVVPGLTVVQRCVDAPTLDNDFCALVQRDPTDGFITFFESGQQNVSKLEARGIDFNFGYGFDTAIGDLNLELGGSRSLRRRDFQFQNFPDEFEDRLGEFAFPKWVLNSRVSLTRDDWSVHLRSHYQGNQLLPGVANQDIESNPDFVDPMSTGSAFVHHLSARWSMSDAIQITGGINNLANRKPFLGTVLRPAGYAGRSYFVGLTHSF